MLTLFSTPSPHAHRPESEIFTNAPTDWQSNSMQDAALFIVMNLAAMKSSREHILELNGITILTHITEYNKRVRRETHDDSAEQKQLKFQRLKAVSLLLHLVDACFYRVGTNVVHCFRLRCSE